MSRMHRGLICLTSLLLALPLSAARDQPTNILFIMIDDLGWKDLGCQGADDYHTPNINRLAKQGMRFTDAYSAAPVCSPTRAAAMTGLAPARTEVTNHIPDRWAFYQGRKLGPAVSKNQLEPQYVTIAERLKQQGYATAFIGKWHMAGTKWSAKNRIYLPENQGFDLNIGGTHMGGPGGKNSYFDPYQIPNIPSRKPGEYLTDRLADEAIGFMRRQKQANKPFFVCLWNYTVHWPVEAPASLCAKYAKGKKPTLHEKFQAMVEAMDNVVGRVLGELDEMGLSDNTLVVFTSDNGPYCGEVDDPITSVKPLRGSKGYLYEGGIRVPLIVRWPGHVSAGTTSSQPVISMDFVPTFLDAAKVDHAGVPFDGESLMPVLTENKPLKRDAIYFHFPHLAFHRENLMGSAIRSGDYKLIYRYKSGKTELYDLAKDLGETTNLASKQPELAKKLESQLKDWLKQTGAKMPRPIDTIADDELYGPRTPKAK